MAKRPKNGNGSRNTEARKKMFLDTFIGSNLSMSQCCQISGIPVNTVYNWINADPKFEEAYYNYQQEQIEELEDEAHRRSVYGVNRVKSIPVGDGKYEKIEEKHYSDNLLMFRLKALSPEVYRENYVNSLADEVKQMTLDETLVFIVEHLNDDQKARLLELLTNEPKYESS